MGAAGRYRTRATPALAVQLADAILLALPAGKGVLAGEKGDWLLQYHVKDQSLVNGAIFEDTYEPADIVRS